MSKAGKYVWNRVLEPPSDILDTPDLSDSDPYPTSDREQIASQFKPGTSLDEVKVRYRNDHTRDGGEIFLCYGWAKARLDGAIKNGRPFPLESPGYHKESYIGSMGDTPDYTAQEMAAQLKGVRGLIPCDDDDEDRMVLLWAIKPGEKSRIAHIQVRHGGVWESKLSLNDWVICHPENIFENTAAGSWVKATEGLRYFKRDPN